MDRNSSTFNFSRAFYGSLIFAAVLFLAVQWLCLAVSDVTQEGSKQVVKQKRIWARTPGAFPKGPGQELVLAFGNSKIGSGFHPETFDAVNAHHTRSYNMALIALQLPPHYFMLKDFIRYHGAPDWILLQYSPSGFQVESFPAYAVQGAGLWEVVQYAFHRGNADVLLNYLIPSRLHWPEVSRYVIGKMLKLMPAKVQDINKRIYLNDSNSNALYGHNRKHFYGSQYGSPEAYRTRTLKQLKEDRGYYLIIEQAAEGGVISEEYLIKVGAMKAGKAAAREASTATLGPFVEDFFELAQKHRIKIMMLPDYQLSPTGEEPKTFPKHNAVPPEVRQLQKRYSNIYVPLESKGPMSFGYVHFSDPGHVNTAGARRYTGIVAEEFRELIKQAVTP